MNHECKIFLSRIHRIKVCAGQLIHKQEHHRKQNEVAETDPDQKQYRHGRNEHERRALCRLGQCWLHELPDLIRGDWNRDGKGANPGYHEVHPHHIRGPEHDQFLVHPSYEPLINIMDIEEGSDQGDYESNKGVNEPPTAFPPEWPTSIRSFSGRSSYLAVHAAVCCDLYDVFFLILESLPFTRPRVAPLNSLSVLPKARPSSGSFEAQILLSAMIRINTNPPDSD